MVTIRQPLLLTGQQIGFDKGVDVTIEHGLGVRCFRIGTMILNHLIGVQNIRANLIPPAHFCFFSPDFIRFLATLLLFLFKKQFLPSIIFIIGNGYGITWTSAKNTNVSKEIRKAFYFLLIN